MEIIRGIRVLYARDLFMDKKFASAFDEFLEAEANPYDVILLFPASIKGEFVTVESSSQPRIPMLEDKDLEDATLALIDYLTVARQKDIYLNSKILSIMDTTLLKCYLQTKDSLVAPLLRRKNCNFPESEKTLKKHQKLNELIILYQVFEDHVKALTLLKEQASIEGSSLYGHKRTVRYLQDLNKEHKDLVFEYSQWVLEKHPEDGLEIFTEHNCEAENNSIPTDEILDFLSKTCESLVLPYLEHIVHFLNDSSTIMQEKLIMAYVKQIKKLHEKLVVSKNLPDVELKQLELYRSKLFETLEKSDKCCPERILQILPPDHFFKERVQVLERTKDHEKILVIYIQVLGDVENALKYCEKVDDNDIFEMLLKILLNPLQTTPYTGVKLQKDFLEPNLEVIIALLNKYPTKMQPARVLPILPGTIPVHRIKNYMETVCRMNTKNKWHNAVLKAFLNAELLRLNEEILTCRKKNCFSLTEASICKKCQKHFNNKQILVRNINGDVVHLACFKQSVDGV